MDSPSAGPYDRLGLSRDAFEQNARVSGLLLWLAFPLMFAHIFAPTLWPMGTITMLITGSIGLSLLNVTAALVLPRYGNDHKDVFLTSIWGLLRANQRLPEEAFADG